MKNLSGLLDYNWILELFGAYLAAATTWQIYQFNIIPTIAMLPPLPRNGK